MDDIPKIEKNIHIPEKKSGGNVRFLKKMVAGDSFVTDIKRRSSFLISAAREGIKITTRTLGNGKIRIWRIK